MYAWRRKWLPHEPDTEQTLAQAVWLEKNHNEALSVAMTNGVAKAFGA
ncbi:DUF6890 family protein [Enterovibrio gelatinilyticus]